MQDDFGLWDVIVSMFWFMFLIIWIWMLISILADIFRDRDLGGGAKALWTVFIIADPLARRARATSSPAATPCTSVRPAGGGTRRRACAPTSRSRGAGTQEHVADELKGLTELRDSGVLIAEEYEQAKAKVLS